MLDCLERELAVLRDKPKETPRSTLATLWQKASGNSCSLEKASDLPIEELSPEQETELRTMIERRLAGTPLAHLVGFERFMGIDMKVSPAALIPRKETEILARAAYDLLEGMKEPRVIDLCTGVGNIAIAINRRHPDARIYASDLSSSALQAAKENAAYCQTTSIEFVESDVFDAFESEAYHSAMDLISCNPPYISQGKMQTMEEEIIGHEPSAAFDGGPFGVSILFRFIDNAHRFLKPGGWAVFEIGLGQGPSLVRRITKSNEYDAHKTFLDEDDQIRAIAIRRLSAESL
jgi:release factor glutamine methyltransferase